MFEHNRVADHQGPGSKTKDLPVRIVPGHHSENDTQWAKRDIALFSIRYDRLIGKKAFCIVGIEITGPRTLVDLCLRFDNGFPHFQGTETSELCFLLTQIVGDMMQMGTPLSKRGSVPVLKRTMYLIKYLVDLSLAVRLECLNKLFSSWIHRLDTHGSTLLSHT